MKNRETYIATLFAPDRSSVDLITEVQRNPWIEPAEPPRTLEVPVLSNSKDRPYWKMYYTLISFDETTAEYVRSV